MMKQQTQTTSTNSHLHPSARRLTSKKIHAATAPETLRATVALIGQGIRDGARYVPLIQHVRRLASRAAPKDYFGQIKNVFDDFTKRWRYVHDPLRTEMVAISGPEIYGQILGADFSPPDHGYGDCDDATTYLGASAEALGLRTRIATISPPTFTGARALFSHVYPEVYIPKMGWIACDAVGYPQHGLGWSPPNIRKALWSTHGNIIGVTGYFPGTLKSQMTQMIRADVRGLVGGYAQGGNTMIGSLHGVDVDSFRDFGLDNFGFAGTDDEAPADWSKYGLLSFGEYLDRPQPMVDGGFGWFAEYDDEDTIGFLGGAPIVRTKMFEMDPRELAYAYRTGSPRIGAVALGDDGEVYQWVEEPQLGGFFKKLFKKIKRGVKKVARGLRKGVKKVARGIRKGARKLIKKLPGGKYIVKVAGKVRKVAMKAAKPILRMGRKLAPVAAMVPGYGPAIAAALRRGPQILKAAQYITGSPRAPKKVKRALMARQARSLARERFQPRLIMPGTPRFSARLRGYDAGMYDA